MKIRAAVIRQSGLPEPYASSRPLSIEEVELAPPGEREVLVQVKAAGLCHSDLSTINGNRPRQTPMVLGHEAAGVVRALGPGVTDLAEDDHVVMVFAPSCGECMPCKEGFPARCERGQAANNAGTLIGGHVRLSQGGAAVYHHVGVSAFAEYCVVNRGSVVKIDPALPFDEAAVFGCAVLTGVGAALNTARVFAGASVAVVGLGGVGLNALLGAAVAGASRIVAIDLHDDKLELASQLGATDVINAKDPDAVAKAKALTGGGVDFGFEMAGSVQAMEMAYRVTRRGGTTVTAGLPHPDARWPLQHVNLTAEERTVKGSYMGSCVPPRDLPRYVDLYRRGKLPVNRLMSDHLPLERINEGFDALASGHTVRQIVMFD
ncbi:MAG: zinc-dependent alcohol dehydrogenase family protein [Betaproteobacteria bacterium]|nr:zinc-dependent alcohol dehydrogenase family protein [Rhodocyclaceae bacterium]MCA3134514.1 zinc-dependent alcohol dehydrogenase family protein [Rhodocyclaceae bacterium]MCA3143919.1 zinc-dependent alcohol dehydrogenase family protein [Rhodocyclaceae bacterium]MCA3145705.1 zinc-dependent alcohol dehydrogenase family protein [Rhodocyclaceae bacterium]MCE2897131.1 zinc-dependent alcohol dehydrogenase family protein [Betaproteobacteria bacterium]